MCQDEDAADLLGLTLEEISDFNNIAKKGESFMGTANITMRIDTNVKAQLQELMSDLGLDMTTFFTMAAKQAIREQRIPFAISRENFNNETIKAFEEIEEMKKNPSMMKSYSSFEDLLEEVETECIEMM